MAFFPNEAVISRGEMLLKKLDEILNMSEAVELFKNSIGKKYRIFASSNSPFNVKHIFAITCGTIVNVDIYLHVLIIKLDDKVETFHADVIKEVKVDDDMIKVIYNDDSYSRIFITENEYYAHKHTKILE